MTARLPKSAPAARWLALVALGACGSSSSPAPAPDAGRIEDESPARDAGAKDSGPMSSGADAGAPVCCEPHAGAGCANAEIEACVCNQVPSCCEEAWDIVCVNLVEALECGSCKGDCCSANPTAGCREPAVESCVCGSDDSCCTELWDDFCTLLVTELSCGSCS